MPQKPYDPLAVIPSPEALRARLSETLTLAERLRILLDVSERLCLPAAPTSGLTPPEEVAALVRRVPLPGQQEAVHVE